MLVMKNFRQEFHFDTSFPVRLHPVQSEAPRICEYGGMRADLVVPALLTSPLAPSEYARFLGQQVPVTFVVDIPLKTIAEGGMEAFVREMAFAEPVRISELQYRAVGASFDDFGTKYSGRVHVQILCALDVEEQN